MNTTETQQAVLPEIAGFTHGTDYEGEPLNFLEAPASPVAGTDLHLRTTFEPPYGFIIAVGVRGSIRLEDLTLEDAKALADALTAAAERFGR